ncbi:MAG TPA: DUF1565 domain-containing protein, partial [Cyanophyceae cyanobacterium]
GIYLSPTANSQNVTLVGANQAGLMGVTVTNPNPQGYGLWIESSSPVVMDNTFTENTKGGISVNGNSAPTIRSNYFYNNGGDGITVAGTLQPEVRENVFENNSFGVPVAENTVPSVMNWPSPPASTISSAPEGEPLRDDTQGDANNQAFKPRLINFGTQLRPSIDSTSTQTAATQQSSTPSLSAEIEQPSASLPSNSASVTENQSSTSVDEPSASGISDSGSTNEAAIANSQGTTQSATTNTQQPPKSPVPTVIQPPSVPLRITSVSLGENQSSTLGDEPATNTTPNAPSESGSITQDAIATSQSTTSSATTSTVQVSKSPAPAVAISPQPTAETTASSTRISAASFPVPALLRSQVSTSSSQGSSKPAPSSLSTSFISPPVASTPSNPLISASPQETSQRQQASPTQGVEIPVPPLDDSTEPLATSSPTSIQTTTPETQSTVAPVDSVFMNATAANAGQNTRYRVLVEAQGNTQQDFVRSLVPGAFRTSFNGQSMMQAGVFSTLEKANAMQQFLNSKGLVATVEPVN